MTDELERLKSAMKASDLRADPGARNRVIAKAVAAFEEEFSASDQGLLAAMRPKPEATSLWRRIAGSAPMRSRSTPIFFGFGFARGMGVAFTVLGLVAAGGAVKYMYDQFKAMEVLYAGIASRAPMETVMIAVASEDLRYGNRIDRDSVRLVEWPADAAPKNAFNSLDDLFVAGVDERTVLRQMEVDEPVLRSKVTGFGEEATVTALLSPGKRAHTLPVDSGSSVAGFLHPGARVDIYLTYSSKNAGSITKLLLENAEIIAVDQTTDPEDYKARIARTVTFEVTPYDSQRLMLASRTGELSFNLRGTGDTDQIAMASADLSVGGLLGIKEEETAAEARTTVRVRRGGFIKDSIEVAETGDVASADAAPLTKGDQPAEPQAAPTEDVNRVARVETEAKSREKIRRNPQLGGSDRMAAAPQAMAEGFVADNRAMHSVVPILPERRPPAIEDGRERHPTYAENQVKSTAAEPVSTFSIDVDTASYAFVRSSLMAGGMPDPAAVRIEELINYFPYDYQPPESAETPFATHVEVFPSPWKPTNRLVHIGIKGYELAAEDRPRANLVFLIDTSGSMAAANKLPLLVQSFRLLLPTLDPEDMVSIVTYAGSAGVVLEPTKASERRKILAALDRLHSGGSTAGGQGLALAYALAEENFDGEGVNRVILATDGDFNVGVSDPEQLKKFVETKRKTGVGLSVLGFGRGNYNDTLMQTLAQNGDGNAAYIDTIAEAQKVMVEETSSTLFTIARDVKIQVEWNPATVSEYRLIGYETRALNREDFNNDKVDAGEIGAGHSVTAIYEITPVGAPGSVDPLRYASDATAPEPVVAGPVDEYGFLKMRYKLPGEDVSSLITRPITKQEVLGELAAASTEAQFATAVAGFGQLLRGGAQLGTFGYDDVFALSQSGRGADPFGYRAEFSRLVRLADAIAERSPAAPKQ